MATVYGMYFNVAVGHMGERTFATNEGAKKCGISCKEKHSMRIYKIYFYLSPYEFKTCLYLNFGKLRNVKFQAK